jgi:predicted alpha/beta hydrolase family esterase
MSYEPGFAMSETKSTSIPIWGELFMGVDWLALHSSPVYCGWGVPRGDGSAVILVPGFLATDNYLWELNCWLGRVGYRAYMSQIGRNANCLDLLVKELQKTVTRAYLDTGQKVHLIGHSLGGMLARGAAQQREDQVASVITLGSPFRGISSHPIVLRASEIVQKRLKKEGKRPDQPDCFSQICNCEAVQAIRESIVSNKVMQTAIYSKNDGIVDWHNCMNIDPATNFEVISTHAGMAFNPIVYYTIGLRLAETARIAEGVK